jgi:hypothetical protein
MMARAEFVAIQANAIPDSPINPSAKEDHATNVTQMITAKPISPTLHFATSMPVLAMLVRQIPLVMQPS